MLQAKQNIYSEIYDGNYVFSHLVSSLALWQPSFGTKHTVCPINLIITMIIVVTLKNALRIWIPNMQAFQNLL